jgi:uncharacterized membrane protein
MIRGTRILLALLSAVATCMLIATSAIAGTSSTAKQALHRADFRVEGASCVMCLRRIASTFRKEKGVVKADISVFRPYWSILIYDSAQTNFKKITDSVKGEHVKFAEVEDKAIDAIPAVIIPKMSPATIEDPNKVKQDNRKKAVIVK